MNVQDLLRDVLAIGKAVTPLLPTGTAEVVTIAQSAINLIDKIKGDLDSTPAELDETRDALEAGVNAHADMTIGKLQG